MEICEFCESEIDPETDKCACDCPCPCGCGFDREHQNLNCVYDTPHDRHLKNIMNGLPDEQWVIDGMKKKEAEQRAIDGCKGPDENRVW